MLALYMCGHVSVPLSVTSQYCGETTVRLVVVEILIINFSLRLRAMLCIRGTRAGFWRGSFLSDLY